MTVEDQAGASAGWYPDPLQQHESRYWDGARWTEHVSNQGVQSSAALSAIPASAPAATAAPRSSPAATPAKPKSAVVTLIGGGLMAVGALLPWETVSIGGSTVQSVKGTSEGSGGIVLGSGLVIALLAFLFLNGTVKHKAAIATLVLAITSFVLASGNASSIQDDIDKAKTAKSASDIFNLSVDAQFGLGIGLAFVGCVMAGVASVLWLRNRKAVRLA